MTKGRKFNWKNTRDEELRSGLEHGTSSNSHDSFHEEMAADSSPKLNRADSHGMDLHPLARNEIHNNRILANDELYIAPYEHPGLVLTTDLFDGKNFHSWCRSIKRALFARNKLGFIDGSLVEPRINSIDHMQWVRADFLVFNWLSNSIVKELSRGLQNFDTSRQLWDELHKRFGKRNGPRLYKLRREITSFVQSNQSVLVYFNNLNALWDELSLLKTSRNCICVVAEDAKAELEEERMMQFLMGLNDVFEPIRQQILILNPLPSVSQAYSMVLQVEEQMQVSSQFSESIEQSALYTAQGRSVGKESFKRKLTKEEKLRLKCDHCGRTGHLKKDCFEIIGVPDWYKKIKDEKGSKRVNFAAGQADSSVKAGNEQKTSMPDFEKVIQAEIAKHFATYMDQRSDAAKYKSKENHQSAHIAEIEEGEISDYTDHFAFGLSTDINKEEWIIDSGASNHMCCQASLLKFLKRLQHPIKIYMPDGSSILAMMTGEAQITPSILLLNVLYAPEFTHNLISVGQLTKTLHSRVVFL